MASGRGRGRQSNDDASAVYLDQPGVRRVARGALFAVADGDGFDGAGRLVAWAAVQALGHFYQIAPEGFSAGAGLRAAFDRVSTAIEELAAQAPIVQGATCALSVIYLAPNAERGVLVAIGDSPVFVHHRSRMTAIGDFQSTAGSRFGPGLTPTAAHRSLRVSEGDSFLLCTRGLAQAVSRADIEERLGADVHPADVAADLVSSAAAAGATEDATAVVVRIGACQVRRPEGEVR